MDFTNSLDSFLAASPWLADEHEPEVAALRFLADRLDNDVPANPAPLISQWGLLLRSLRKQAPGSTDTEDPLEAALRAAEGQA